jgi:hypothetical protein
VTCNAQGNLRPGQTITLVYNIDATGAVKVGLGAGYYDTGGDDHSTGDGDVDALQLHAGQTRTSRPFTVPTGLPRGRYELVCEIWPANSIGSEGVETLAEDPTAYVDVP